MIMFQSNCIFSVYPSGMVGPKSFKSSSVSLILSLISFMISGKLCLMWVNKIFVSLFDKLWIPNKPWGIVEYIGWVLKYNCSFSIASFTGILSMMSCWDLFLIPMKPSLRPTSFPSIILLALVPLSMISILVMTPIVLIPFGSTSLAIWRPSEVVISALAGNTHKMMVLGSDTYLFAIALVIYSMLSGWSEPAIGILVIPGKSTKVRSDFTYQPNDVNYFEINDSLASFNLLRFCKMTSKNLFKIRNPCFNIHRNMQYEKSLNNYSRFCQFFELDESKNLSSNEN